MKYPVAAAAALTVLLLAPLAARAQDPLMLIAPGASIGVTARELTPDEASRARVDAGVYIDTVRDEAPAARAGLKAGDIVTTFDGERVRSVRAFTRLVQETPPNRTVKMEIVRDGSRQTLDVRPEPRPSDLARRFPDRPRDLRFFMPRLPERFPDRFQQFPPREPRSAPGRLGVALQPLTEQMSEFFGVKSGVLISSVDSDTAAARAGLKAGDVITAINGVSVQRPADVTRAIASGGDVTLTVVRDRKEMTFRIELERQA